jgi:hypothetical protein
MRTLLVALLVACSGSQRVAGPSNDLGCTVDPAAQADCEAKGSGFVYAREGDYLCGGNDEGPEAAEETAAARRAHPCLSISLAEQRQRNEECRHAP